MQIFCYYNSVTNSTEIFNTCSAVILLVGIQKGIKYKNFNQHKDGSTLITLVINE